MAATDSDELGPNDIRPFAFKPEHDSGQLENGDWKEDPAGASAGAGTATKAEAA